MKFNLIKKLFKYRKLDFFSKEPCYHLHIIQVFTFSYMLYRLLSRDYAFYGFLTNDELLYPRRFNSNLISPISHWTTFTFIYDYFPILSYKLLNVFHQASIIGSILGLVGVYPRVMALINLLFLNHITGLMIATNAEVEGGSVLMASLFVLSFTNSGALYSLKNRIFNNKENVNYGWPVKLFIILVGSFYTFSGINKIFDVGPHWPFVVNLELLIPYCLNNSVDIAARFSVPEICGLFTNELFNIILSDVSGVISLIGELFFIVIIVFPRTSFIFVSSMIILHVIVIISTGINFVGSSVILLGALNWNDYIRFLKDHLSFSR